MISKNRQDNQQRYYSSYRSSSPSIIYGAKKKSFFRRSRFKLGIMAIIVGGGIIMAAFPFMRHSDQSNASALPDSNAAQALPQLPTPIDSVALKTQLDAIITANPQLDIGVSVTDMPNNSNYTFGVNKPFIAASVGKLLTAALFLNKVEKGEYSLDDQFSGETARVLIQKMIGKSDNAAWTILNGELSHPVLEAYAKDIGITGYSAETNTMPPSDVALLLSKLYKKELLNIENTSFLLANMKQSEEEIQFIRNYINPDISVYHKAGWLSDRANDTAIIENGDRPYVLVIFTKSRYGDYNFEKGQQLFSQLTVTVQTIMSAK